MNDTQRKNTAIGISALFGIAAFSILLLPSSDPAPAENVLETFKGVGFVGCLTAAASSGLIACLSKDNKPSNV